jgi:hypothetical protein
MNEFLLGLHSLTRWLLVAVIVLAAVYMLYGAVTQRPYNKSAYRLMSVFSSLVGVQWLLGLLGFITALDALSRHRWEHAFLNTVALAIAHAHYSMKKHVQADIPQPRLHWRALAIIGATMLCVFIAVMVLPQDWTPLYDLLN